MEAGSWRNAAAYIIYELPAARYSSSFALPEAVIKSSAFKTDGREAAASSGSFSREKVCAAEKEPEADLSARLLHDKNRNPHKNISIIVFFIISKIIALLNIKYN
jgi:hypothetical protein